MQGAFGRIFVSGGHFQRNSWKTIQEICGQTGRTFLGMTGQMSRIQTNTLFFSKFIGKYGLEEYYKHNRELLFYERNQELMKEISKLDEE